MNTSKTMKSLEKLMDAYGISGNEEHVRKLIKDMISPYVDKTFVDKAGNLICVQKGVAPRVMIAAHMDEIGLMVKHIYTDGRILFSPVGGIEPITLPGQRVKIHTKKGQVLGVITSKEMSNGDIVEKMPEMRDMYVDTGIDKKNLTKKGVEIGDYINLVQDTGTLGNKNIIYGKGLDDRIGCFVLIELAKKLKKTKNEIYFVFTVQEEIGLYGAKTSTYHISPDWAIAVDVTPASDASDDQALILGEGPSITMKDESMIGNKTINLWLSEIAKKKKIKVQYDVTDFGTTDAMNISISKSGVPTTSVGVPVRNLHSTIGLAHMQDIQDLIIILYELLKKPKKIN
jgi:tetrahedral aminopeptidase